MEEILKITNDYFTSDIILKRWTKYDQWPQHNGPEQMELMRTTSESIISMHKDENSCSPRA
ncbi:MAG: hypothetical protein HC883_04770 [Bdellovibrionaceae bacterium]|nr:hypothetical protein [Pseudobdellovibrionaceae bacterium]